MVDESATVPKKTLFCQVVTFNLRKALKEHVLLLLLCREENMNHFYIADDISDYGHKSLVLPLSSFSQTKSYFEDIYSEKKESCVLFFRMQHYTACHYCE